MRRIPPHLGLVALLLWIAVAVVVPPGGPARIPVDDKGKTATDKSEQEGVPAQCARLIKAAERRKRLQKAG